MAQKASSILITGGQQEIAVLPRMANRHGLIAGATGTGKTVTLRVMAEQFSALGVPVFLADVKGDLSGMAKEGGDRPEPQQRAKQLGIKDFSFGGCPVVFWDVFGQQGHPVRACQRHGGATAAPASQRGRRSRARPAQTAHRAATWRSSQSGGRRFISAVGGPARPRRRTPGRPPRRTRSTRPAGG